MSYVNDIDVVLSENESFTFYNVVFHPYTGERTYTYKSFERLEPGDKVIVPTASTSELKVVEVREEVELDDLKPGITYKWIIGKVDMEQYDKCRELEKRVAETLRKARSKKRLSEIRASLAEETGEDLTKLVRL